MNLLGKDDLTALTQVREWPCVSLFMPTVRAGDTRQNPIRLKNLLREAEQRLVEGGIRPPEVRALLEPAQKLLQDSRFWEHQGEGLAVFISRGLFRPWPLPLPFEELAVVADRFHLKPLLSLFSGEGRYYLLALSQNRVRFFEGTRSGADEVALHDIPGSLAAALKEYVIEKQIRVRSVPVGAAGPVGKRGALFYGFGAGAEDVKENVRQFFLKVDRGLKELLRGERAPLVLVGVDYLLPIYREVNSYPALVEKGITGNPDTLRPDELHDLAREVVAPLFVEAQKAAAARFREREGTGLASGDIKVIVPAADHGRVEALFVAMGTQRWGTYDPGTGVVHLHRKPRPGDDDLLDFAAVHTFLNGGAVYSVERGKVPGGTLIAAAFRY